MVSFRCCIFISMLFAIPQTNFLTQAAQHTQIAEKRIVVIVASYNNKDWYKKNLDSIFCQHYENYHVIYIDDNSPDGTGELVEHYIIEKEQENRASLIRNTKRQGHLINQYKAIHSCNDHDIIIIVDGDDWLAHEHVFELINGIYSTEDVWLTYGQYQAYPNGRKNSCQAIPQQIVEKNEFRKFDFVMSHLRTFYAGLYKKIKYEDLLYKGIPFPKAVDQATMYPMIEMAGHHFKFIPDILYIFNELPILVVAHSRDSKNWDIIVQLKQKLPPNTSLSLHLAREVRRRKPYEKLERLFEEND